MLTGHFHNYERTCAVYKGQCVKGAPTHVLVGTAGIELERLWIEPQPSWSIKRSAFFGHAEVHSLDAHRLRFRMVACEGGEVRDEFWIVK